MRPKHGLLILRGKQKPVLAQLKTYPYDPTVKHHLILAVALGAWIFTFLYVTQPLDVKELDRDDQLYYLPIYALVGTLSYLLIFPTQYLIKKFFYGQWTLLHELGFLLVLVSIGLLGAWNYYFYGVMESHPNSYSLWYFSTAVFLPAISTIVPPLFIGRFAFGKYKEKKLEDQKIEIQGQGTYEGLRLNLADLISVQSADNYVEVNYLEGGVLKKQLIRNKLTAIEETRPELLRIHRSHLVNPTHFAQWKSGNRKLSMVLTEGLEAPVSKTYQEQAEAAVNSATTA